MKQRGSQEVKIFAWKKFLIHFDSKQKIRHSDLLINDRQTTWKNKPDQRTGIRKLRQKHSKKSLKPNCMTYWFLYSYFTSPFLNFWICNLFKLNSLITQLHIGNMPKRLNYIFIFSLILQNLYCSCKLHNVSFGTPLILVIWKCLIL